MVFRALNLRNLGIMMLSHMESNGQKWASDRLGEIGDLSTNFNYGISDMMMNNLWVYDFNILEESNNNQISGFPEHGTSEFTLSDPDLLSKFSIDTQQNIENNDPNSMKPPSTHTINKNTEIMEPKSTQKCVKGRRSKRSRRTVFEGPWVATMDPNGSTDNQGSTMSKQTVANNFEKGVNSVARWLEDVGYGRYAGVFEMHEVDEQVLPLLTLDDLKEMGVVAVGPRRKLYAAICRLKAQCEN